YSGANVWGSNPVVDVGRGLVYIGTGNNYKFPATYTSCISGGGTPSTCADPAHFSDSILALDVATGRIHWATRLMTWHLPALYEDNIDFWNVACVVPPFTNCPSPNTGPDFDFGSAPNEITYQTSTGPKTIIGAGQKSGIYYALNPDTGAVLWRTQVGPG